MSGIFKLITDGGLLFTLPMIILLVLILVLFTKTITSKTTVDKNTKLIASLSLFTLVWGVLGQIIGLMNAFKVIEEVGQISPQMLAGGLRVSSITTMLGLAVFLIGRLSIIILQWRAE